MTVPGRKLPAAGVRSAFVKGFRMPARRRREGMHGGRRPKSLEGGNRGGVRTGGGVRGVKPGDSETIAARAEKIRASL